MSITDEMRKTFDDCTVMTGLSLECVYITKSAALKMPDKIDEAFEAGHERAVEYGKQLERGECEVEYVSDWMGWHCKSCDALWQGLKDQPPRFCKECGRKVKR